jgi:hypothetical protein
MEGSIITKLFVALKKDDKPKQSNIDINVNGSDLSLSLIYEDDYYYVYINNILIQLHATDDALNILVDGNRFWIYMYDEENSVTISPGQETFFHQTRKNVVVQNGQIRSLLLYIIYEKIVFKILLMNKNDLIFIVLTNIKSLYMEPDRYHMSRIIVVLKKDSYQLNSELLEIKVNGSKYSLKLSPITNENYHIYNIDLRLRLPMDRYYHVALAGLRWQRNIEIMGTGKKNDVYDFCHNDELLKRPTECSSYGTCFVNIAALTIFMEELGG